MAYLLGSLIGTFLLSRLFWLAARKPPSTPAKILGVNLACLAVILVLDPLARYGTITAETLLITAIIYAPCQLAVMVVDALWLHKPTPAEHGGKPST